MHNLTIIRPKHFRTNSREPITDSVFCLSISSPSSISFTSFRCTTYRSSTVRGNRPGKQVQLAEYEIKFLCTKAREIFINQPILLELEAPIKICGASTFRYQSFSSVETDLECDAQVIFTVNITICSACSNTVDSLPKPTTSSSETMSTEVNNHSKPSASC